MKKFIILLLLYAIISCSRNTIAQSLKIGFGIEPSMILYEKGGESSIGFIPFSANLKIFVTPLNWMNFEMRPGIFFGGLDYSWIELGVYARFNILPSRFYIIAGINDHIRGGYDDILYDGIGLGIQKDSKASFDLMYFWKNGRNGEQVNGILKLCFGFAWDVL